MSEIVFIPDVNFINKNTKFDELIREKLEPKKKRPAFTKIPLKFRKEELQRCNWKCYYDGFEFKTRPYPRIDKRINDMYYRKHEVFCSLPCYLLYLESVNAKWEDKEIAVNFYNDIHDTNFIFPIGAFKTKKEIDAYGGNNEILKWRVFNNKFLEYTC